MADTLLQEIVDFLHHTFPGDERLPGKPSWVDENTEATAQPPGAVAPADPWANRIAPEASTDQPAVDPEAGKGVPEAPAQEPDPSTD